MDYPCQPDTKRERCAANPIHYPWLQCLMKTLKTAFFHSRQNWTVMVYTNYRIFNRLGIKRKIVYTALFRFTELHYSTTTVVQYLGL